jgi:hypothetical protein
MPRMTPSLGSVNATFFFITDVRSTDRSCEAQPIGGTSSSTPQTWSYVSSRKAA